MKSDIWSLGVFLYSIANKPMNNMELNQHLVNFKRLTSLPQSYNNLLQRMLSKNPHQRPTALQVKNLIEKSNIENIFTNLPESFSSWKVVSLRLALIDFLKRIAVKIKQTQQLTLLYFVFKLMITNNNKLAGFLLPPKNQNVFNCPDYDHWVTTDSQMIIKDWSEIKAQTGFKKVVSYFQSFYEKTNQLITLRREQFKEMNIQGKYKVFYEQNLIEKEGLYLAIIELAKRQIKILEVKIVKATDHKDEQFQRNYVLCDFLVSLFLIMGQFLSSMNINNALQYVFIGRLARAEENYQKINVKLLQDRIKAYVD